MTKMTIDDRIALNDIEPKELKRSYIEYALTAFLHGYLDIYEFKKLFKQLKKYKDEVELESKYLKILSSYQHRIPEDELKKLLRDIDMSNEYTYNYYEAFGENYLDLADTLYEPVEPKRVIPRIQENTRLTDEIMGYSLGYKDLVSYFKGSEAYYYAREHSKIIDAGFDTWIYGVNTKDDHGILRRYSIIVPPIKDLKTALINVHEIKHAIDLFDLIGQPYPEENDFEERARAEEERFVREYVRNKFGEYVRNK